jgi:hypothetical protein
MQADVPNSTVLASTNRKQARRTPRPVLGASLRAKQRMVRNSHCYQAQS